LQLPAAVIARVAPGEPYLLGDGLGIRRIESDTNGEIEILELKPELSSYRGMEAAICERASLFAGSTSGRSHGSERLNAREPLCA
jgi:hypothetical protein